MLQQFIFCFFLHQTCLWRIKAQEVSPSFHSTKKTSGPSPLEWLASPETEPVEQRHLQESPVLQLDCLTDVLSPVDT